MKPVITVNGVTYDATISLVSYYDEKGKYHVVCVDESAQLEWLDHYQEIYDRLEQDIDDKRKGMQYLANKIADRENYDSPIPEKQERERLKLIAVGLMEAQEIIREFMEEELMLYGEEIASHTPK